ncbi:class I SAM-dependent methyltransferase [Nocardia sp. NPDC020380]|uniref:class I SAM-dependent methyltransferase n=1 Tax=Nocardia sp. NPDC020380 TaxID=3364309 RepID=UPI00379A93FA
MTEISERPRRASYGVDAPPVPLGLAAGTVVLIVLGIITLTAGSVVWGWVLIVIGVLLGVQCGLYLHASLRGKFRVWEGLLDDLPLGGDERLLDMGCGRGAVLLAAARRLHSGRAAGIDLWRSIDQSGNDPAATERNALAEGVAERVDLYTGDMVRLPFGDNEFDVVVSSLAIHNIPADADRAQAVREALRVLRPGGRLVLVDIFKGAEYRQTLIEEGAADLTVRPVGWRMWWGSPFVATTAITATAR